MKMSSTLVALLGLTAAAHGAATERSEADSGSPLSKVLELMDDLSAKVSAEADDAEKAYVKYKDWCDDAASEERFEIKSSTTSKEKLGSIIDKLTASAQTATAKIEELAKDVAKEAADLEAATTIREKEAKEFKANEAELMDTVDTLGRAISVIEKELKKNDGAFAQMDMSNFQKVVHTLGVVVDAAAFDAAGKQRLLALVQAQQRDSADAEDSMLGAPAPAVYESKSGSIVDLLEDLKEKAEDELAALRSAESNAKQNFRMLKQSLDDSMGNANKDMADQKALKSSAEEQKAASETELEAAIKALASATEQLHEIQSECMQTAADHEASVTGRKEELKVLAEAKGIIQDSAPSFLQVESRAGARLATRADLKRTEVVNAVQRLARTYHSAALSQLSSRIAAVIKLSVSGGADPFEKIKGMISELISKLEAEAEAAADEKAYCDDEMAKTKEKRAELEEDLDKLAAKIDKSSAKSAGLKSEVKELQGELAEHAKLQKELDSVRKENHDGFVKAKAELDAALDGVRKALSVLREYYGSGASAALLQSGGSMADFMRQPKPPVMHSKSGGAGGGIIGVLEVCESDFAKELTAITSEEEEEQSWYESTTQDNEKAVALKEQDLLYKVKEFKGLDKSIADMSEDKETMSTEHAAVMEYWAKITDRCVAKPETYEERKARREAEIAGLKEALSILDSETALLQKGSRRLRTHGA